jgi:hypothetical protein
LRSKDCWSGAARDPTHEQAAVKIKANPFDICQT